MRDYEAAVTLAGRWNELDPIRVGLRTGEIIVDGSGGRHVRVKNRRRADVEVLDIALSYVTVVPQQSMPRKRADPIADWFQSRSLGQPEAIGLPERHPQAYPLLNNVPMYLRKQSWDDAQAGLLAQGATVLDTLDLGGLTFAQARTCYAYLISQLHLNALGAYHFGTPEAFLWGVRPHNLEKALAERVGTDPARAFIRMFTFSRGRSPVSAPLVPSGKLLLVPAEVVSPIAYERTLLRAAAADPATAGRLGNLLGARATRWAERLRTVPGCEVAEEIPVKDSQGRKLGDLDVVAWDAADQSMMIVETKWPIDAATLNESNKVDANFDKGASQVVKLRSAIAEGTAHVAWPRTWRLDPKPAISWWVGSAQQLDSRPGWQAPDVATTSLRLLENLLPADNLRDLIHRLQSFPLPVEGVEYELSPRRVTAGSLTIHYEAIALLGTPPLPPPDRRIHNGWT